ncbi:ATP-binding protein [Clostridium aestuarii]|uniref:histidine kinase n=1 Tax=Clostridium aestuarii TaxID=338193 RepID=A0ABT4CV83_9CLOT|nr:MASE3 domain-containing protein [Clostridium aestuarii]MCY6482895.1 ATP-binding protein [Clostridium aestuarii]
MEKHISCFNMGVLSKKIKGLNKNILINIFLFIAMILMISRIALGNFQLFMLIIRLLSTAIPFVIFITAISTYKIAKNEYFMFIGIAFGFISVIGLLNIISYRKNVFFIGGPISNINMQLMIMYEYMYCISCLIANRFLYKKINIIKVIFVYLIVSILMILAIYKFEIFPIVYIKNYGVTSAFRKIRYGSLAFLVVNIFILDRNKKHFDDKIIKNMKLSFISSVIARIISIVYRAIYNELSITINCIIHIICILSIYLIYRAVIRTLIKKPNEILRDKSNELNDKLKNKNDELKAINQFLMKEIEERNQIENELRKSKERYKLLLELSPNGICVHDNGKCIYINKVGRRIFNIYSDNSIIGNSLLEFVHPDYKEIAIERIKNEQEGKKVPIIEEKIIRMNGEIAYVEAAGAPYMENGRCLTMCVIRDITERKRAQKNEELLREAKQYDKIKNEFFANISHELRTPLNVILGSLKLIKYHTENKPMVCVNNINKYIVYMNQNCYRLLRLVNNLIDVTKMDANFFEVDLHNGDIVKIVEDITLSVVPYAKNKYIDLIFDTEMEEQTIACDPYKIERVMLNLLSNAIKFTQNNGEIKVNIYDEEEKIIISVKDNGQGIPKDKQKIIFKRFMQVDKSFTRNYEGSGIGLSLVEGIVKMHEGNISVKSKEGEGSEFIVELPKKMCSEKEKIEPKTIEQNDKIERINIEFSDVYS